MLYLRATAEHLQDESGLRALRHCYFPLIIHEDSPAALTALLAPLLPQWDNVLKTLSW